MYNNFKDFYDETYNNFYNACNFKDLISSTPIPYEIDKNLKIAGQYLNGKIYIQNSSTDTNNNIKKLVSDLYHEFTHYYDESIFKHLKYSDEDIKILMLTFSEIHASYNGIFAVLNLKNLSIKKRIDINKKVFADKTLSQLYTYQINNQIQHMNNILGFKYAMYLLGEKRAMLKIAKDILAVNKAYNSKIIPQTIREEIINIDKLIDINSYENINVNQINLNKLKIEHVLLQESIKSIPIPNTSEFGCIKNIIDTLP